MSTDSQANPPPPHTRVRLPRFGSDPVSPFVPVAAGNGRGDPPGPGPRFAIRWENRQVGLTAEVREREDGRLLAEVFSADAGLLNRGWVSVGLGGKTEKLPLGKAIPLTVPEAGGCSGSADLGLLPEVVKELGPELALVVFLLVEPESGGREEPASCRGPATSPG